MTYLTLEVKILFNTIKLCHTVRKELLSRINQIFTEDYFLKYVKHLQLIH
jgi:hypothetical protein